MCGDRSKRGGLVLVAWIGPRTSPAAARSAARRTLLTSYLQICRPSRRPAAGDTSESARPPPPAFSLARRTRRETSCTSAAGRPFGRPSQVMREDRSKRGGLCLSLGSALAHHLPPREARRGGLSSRRTCRSADLPAGPPQVIRANPRVRCRPAVRPARRERNTRDASAIRWQRALASRVFHSRPPREARRRGPSVRLRVSASPW